MSRDDFQGGWGGPGTVDPNSETVAQGPLILSGYTGPQLPFQEPIPPGPQQAPWQVQSQYAAPSPFSPPYRSGRPVRPEDLIKRPPSTAPANPFARLGYMWKKDPAYRVLFIAIGTVFLSSMVVVLLISNVFSAPSPAPQPQTTGIQSVSTHTATATATATANSNPNSASINTNPTPTQQPTDTPTPIPEPTDTPTPIPTATPTPAQPSPPPAGPLTVQITDIAGNVRNNDTLPVTVTSAPGATVKLTISYSNAFPFFSETETVTTGANGMATINWDVNVQPIRQNMRTVNARVTAVAQGANGQVVQSRPATVKITVR